MIGLFFHILIICNSNVSPKNKSLEIEVWDWDAIGRGIIFSIRQFSRDNAPSYSAVSYAWGEGEPSKVVHWNNKRIYVKTNLWSCLHYMGLPAYQSGSKHMEVDAICIKQIDAMERNEQVRLLYRTYKMQHTCLCG